MKKSQLRKLIKEIIQEQTQVPTACWDPCATNFQSPLGNWDGPIPYMGTGDYLPSLTATSDCSNGNAFSVNGYNSVVVLLHQIGTYPQGPQNTQFCQEMEENDYYNVIVANHPTVDYSCCQYPSSGPQDPGKAVPNKDVNITRPTKPGTSPVKPTKPPVSPIPKPKPPLTSPVGSGPGMNTIPNIKK